MKKDPAPSVKTPRDAAGGNVTSRGIPEGAFAEILCGSPGPSKPQMAAEDLSQQEGHHRTGPGMTDPNLATWMNRAPNGMAAPRNMAVGRPSLKIVPLSRDEVSGEKGTRDTTNL